VAHIQAIGTFTNQPEAESLILLRLEPKESGMVHIQTIGAYSQPTTYNVVDNALIVFPTIVKRYDKDTSMLLSERCRYNSAICATITSNFVICICYICGK
jgi:hypothetical protein